MVLRIFFLHCVIGKMYLRVKVMNIELNRGGSNIALLIPVPAGDSEKIGNEHVVSDVEFAIVIEKRAIDVHLHNVGAFNLFWIGLNLVGMQG